MEAAGGAVGAGCDGDGVGEAGGEEVLGAGVEVVDRVGGLGAGEAMLIAESEDRVGEVGALLGGVDLLGHGAQLFPAAVGIVVSDRALQALQFRGDQRWELDVQGQVGRGEVEQAFSEDFERLV